MQLSKAVRETSVKAPLRLAGVPGAAWPWLVRQLVVGESKKVTVVIAPEPGLVDGLVASLRVLLSGREVMGFPAWDVSPYDRLSPAPEVTAQRLAVVEALRMEIEGLVVVASIPALGVRLPFEVENGIWLARGETFAPDRLSTELTRLGYTKVEQVHEVGEWARRGGVVDVWPAAGFGESCPVRIEFFDDEIERLATFEPGSQRAIENVSEVGIGQVREVVLSAARIKMFREQYREMFAGGTADEAYVQVSEGIAPAHISQLLPMFWEKNLPGLMELLPKDALVVLAGDSGEQAKIWEETVTEAYQARADAPGEGNDVIRAVEPEMLAVPAAVMLRQIEDLRRVELNQFDTGEASLLRPMVREVMVAGVRGNHHAAAVAAAREVSEKARLGWRVVLTAPSAAGLNQMLRALESEGAPPAGLVQDAGKVFDGETGGMVAVVTPFSTGWADPTFTKSAGLLVLTEGDVFGARMGGIRPRRKRKAEDVIAHFSELRDGDYVVHEAHGVGKFGGLITMEIDGNRQDFLRILYAGDDRLFVPVENLDVLSRYKGADAGQVTLDKLGGGSWAARKAKIKEDLMAMADELLKTAAARETMPRTPLIATTDEGVVRSGMYDEFCAVFPYDLTDDQQRAMEEVEGDFAEGHPMDRLVVGDVGFGKTEVALRAAYLAVSAGKQVAVVCPTTLLARQHFDVFQKRFAGFPLRVGRLSRLVSASETKTTKERLVSGEVDIVVGTHALLGKEVKFKSLGLVVIDEEQRFGVAHKERLKQLRENVDVLTLTATPIPRTLQMAVGGVRQLSLIATPPVDRQAVATFVLPWDNKTLGEAIKRELTRGGQVYVVAPHIEDLDGVQDGLAALVPNLRLGIAHGQMPEGELEDVMGAFYEGKLDVLLATTIIESGLDVPRANTLIVYRADRFGLAQLYQLRGRVGRSTRRAYAYFLLPDGPLGGEAVKRLTILQRLTELGAGFTLASYDMDLRGFGNLLGKQQSGHIRDIGFELYNKMLREAVAARELAKQAGVVKVEEAGVHVEALRSATVVMKLGVTYLIPEGYVPDVAERLQLYRRLANVHDAAGIEDFSNELADRYGALPREVSDLLKVMSLRNRAQALNVARLEVGDKGVLVAFESGKFVAPERLMKFIMAHAGVVSVRPDQSLVWHRSLGEGDKLLAGVGKILEGLEGLVR